VSVFIYCGWQTVICNYTYFAIPIVSLAFLCSSGYCESYEKTETAPSSVAKQHNTIDYVRFGRRMQHNRAHDDYYCGAAPCSNYQRMNRMSHEERQILRQQVNETNRFPDVQK